MQPDPSQEINYEGVHCALTIRRPAPGVTVVVLGGSDIGEFGDFPMQELAKDLRRVGALELFIDARAVRGASVEVSKDWALWMRAHRHQLTGISMLTGSRYVQMTALFVRRFADLLHQMRIFTDRDAFDEALAECEASRRESPARH